MNKTERFNYVHIDPSYFQDNSSLIEVMKDDNRQYLHIVTKYKDNTFLIPFRSHIKHKYCYHFYIEAGSNDGLDFSKALIINDLQKYTHTSLLPIPDKQHKVIKRNYDTIIRKFHRYVDNYCKNTAEGDSEYFEHVGSRSTLQNYHSELNLK